MKMWPFNKTSLYLSEAEKALIANAIGEAEMQTSGEIRVYVEGKCKLDDPLKRACDLFAELNMFATKEHNGVLVYVAVKDRKLAIYGDSGIHARVGGDFWSEAVGRMVDIYKTQNDIAAGIIHVVKEIGCALKQYFPYDKETDVNELPDDIIVNK
jgi:uncharacterized membrane protein